jgi:hypothetical protein
MSKMQRTQMKMALIQMKIQKLHRRMSQKFVEKSMVVPFR